MKKLLTAILLAAACAGAPAQTIVKPLQGGTGIANANTQTTTRSGGFGLTQTLTGTTNVTYPTSGTLATTAGTVATAANVAAGPGIPFNLTSGATSFDGTNFVWDNTNKRLGIGTATPAFKVDIVGATVLSARFVNTTSSSSTQGAGIFAVTNDGAAMASGDRLGFYVFGGVDDAANTFAYPAGIFGYSTQTWTASAHGTRVGIGTTANNSTTITERIGVEQDGTITISNLSGTGSRPVLADANGVLSAPVSDELWKQNMRDLPDSYGLQAILALRPKIWDYKDHSKFGSKDYIGFGARETAGILPEVTGQMSDGTFYISKEDIVASLVKAVQQLTHELRALKGAVYVNLKMAQSLK